MFFEYFTNEIGGIFEGLQAFVFIMVFGRDGRI